MRLSSLCALAATIATTTGVFADVLPRYEVTPYVGVRGGGHYFDGVGDADFEYDATYGLIANFRAGYNTQWEILYGHQGATIDDSAASFDGSKFEVDLDYLQVGGTYLLDDRGIMPFVSVTLGVTRLDPDIGELSDETYFSGSLGFGLRYDLGRNLGLRVEGRAFGLFGKSNSLVFCDDSLGEDFCFFAGDGGVIPQLELSGGISFRF